MSDVELRNKDRQDIVHQLTADLAKQKSGKYRRQRILQYAKSDKLRRSYDGKCAVISGGYREYKIILQIWRIKKRR